MRFQNRYNAYVGIIAKMQGNHSRFAHKDLKDIEVINYLNSVYYTNGLVYARCDFTPDGITVLNPVSIGLNNESNYYDKDLDDILKVYNRHSENLINHSIKISVKELRFALTAVYPTVAKQFKTFATAIVNPKANKLLLDMKPIKQSSKAASSQAKIKIHNTLEDEDYAYYFRFNIAMMVDVLKFYNDDDFVIISCSSVNKIEIQDNMQESLNLKDYPGELKISEHATLKFNLQSHNTKEDNLIWSFKDIPVEEMDMYLRKNKS